MGYTHSRAAVRAILALAAATATATAVAEDSADLLAEVIVTAQKREESMQKVPIAVTALDAAALEKSYSRDIQGVAQLAPNLIVDPTLGNGTASISIRGMQLNDVEKSFDPAVAVYLDGVYLATNTGALMQMSDADSVEVLRGPQGTLFGRNTIGGLLSIQRALPTGEFGGKFSLTYGRFQELTATGVLNLPSAMDGRLKTKLSFVRQDGGGYFRNVSNGPQNGKREGDTDFTGITSSTLFDVTDDLQLGLVLDYFDDKTPTRPVTSISGQLELFSGVLGVNFGAPKDDEAYHSKSHTVIAQPAFLKTKAATLKATWQLGEGQRLVSVLGYRKTNENSVQEFDGASILPGPTPVFYTKRPQDAKQISEELRLESDWSDTQRSTVGLYYWDSEYSIEQDTYVFGAFSNHPYFLQKTKSKAVFGQYDWDIASNVTVSLGGRYNKEDKDACGSLRSPTSFLSFGSCNLGSYQGSYVDPATGATITSTGKASWSKFTPRVGLIYTVDDAKMVYLTYSEGFRSGGFNGRSTDASTIGPYAPEKVKNIELGAKTQWMDNKLRLNATIFSTKYDNKQEDVVFPDPVNSGSTVTLVQNAASATIRGAELELTAIPARGLTVGLNLGILDSKYDAWDVVDPTNPTGPKVDKSGFELRRAPKLTFGANATYEQPLSNGASLVYSGNYSYKSSYYIVGNTLSPYEVSPQAGGFDNNPGKVDSFGTATASVAYDADKWNVSLWVRNLTNERHFVHVLDVGTQYKAGANRQPVPVPLSGLWTFGTLNAPRTYGIAATVKF